MSATPSAPMRPRQRGSTAAFSLAEAMITVTVTMISLGAVMLLNAQQLRMVRSTKDSNSASFVLQNRVEQLRGVSWDNLTSASYLSTGFLKNLPPGASKLKAYTETVTVGPWPESTTVAKLIVRKRGDTATIVQNNPNMPSQRQARVDVLVQWSGQDDRPRERSYATIISNGGITRVGLLPFGGYSGSASGTPSPAPTPTPADNGGDSGGGTSPPPVSSTPSSTPGNQGNGRGNTGGKGGKG